MQITTLFSLV